jgi:hypothetical protein
VEKATTKIVGISMENQQPPLHNMEVTWASGSRNMIKNVRIFVENQYPPFRNMEVTWANGFKNIVRAHVIESTLTNITEVISLKQNKIWGK